MQFSNEKEIENIIVDAFERDHYSLSKKGLLFFGDKEEKRGKGKLFQQVNLNAYGIADLIYCYRSRGVLAFVVIELKNRPIEEKDFEQCSRYITGLKHSLEFTSFDSIIFGAIIGTGISNCHYLSNECITIGSYIISLELEGIKFERPSWQKNDFDSSIIDIKYSKVV